MLFNQQLTPNLKLNSSETLNTTDKGKLESVRFFFTFFGEEYWADCTKKHMANDVNAITADGPVEHFDAFFCQVSEDHWETMKQCFHAHEVEYNTEFINNPEIQ